MLNFSYNQETYGFLCRTLRIMRVVVPDIGLRIGPMDPLHYSCQRTLMRSRSGEVAFTRLHGGLEVETCSAELHRPQKMHLHLCNEETRASSHPLIPTAIHLRHSVEGQREFTAAPEGLARGLTAHYSHCLQRQNY